MYSIIKISRKILIHEEISLSPFGVTLLTREAPYFPPRFHRYEILPIGANEVNSRAASKKRATEPILGRNVRLPPFARTRLFSFESVGLHLELNRYFPFG